MKRVSLAVTARAEARVLEWLVVRVPGWVSPDMLTGGAFLAAVGGGLAYAWAGRDIRLLHLVNLTLAVHWLTDSLDGKLARHRKTPRPNYGYYVDHILDTVSAGLYLGGLATSPLTKTSAWVWVMVLMLLSMVHVFLKTTIWKKFDLSLGLVGPTEARLGMIFLNLIILMVGNPIWVWLRMPVALVDIFGWMAVGTIALAVVPDMIKTAREMDRQDRQKLV